MVIGVAVVVGLGLRIAAARGDLWLDELWSLDLVAHLTSPDQVFWAISHDNNHFLNSLWMYLVGQQATPLVYRLPSIVFSTAAILVAARIGAQVNAVAAAAAALLAASSYAFVDYGSEARGYGGLILAVLLTIAMLQGSLRLGSMTADGRWQPASGVPSNQRLRFAAVIGFGACAHLTMILQTLVLGLTALLHLLDQRRSMRFAVSAAGTLFLPSILVLLLIVGVLMVGIVVQNGFHLGGDSPFSLNHFVEGYGGLISATLGLPSKMPPFAGLVLSLAVLGTAMRAGLLARSSQILAVVALGVLPAAILILQPSNIEFPRYFLVCGSTLTVLLAEIVGRLWTRGTAQRCVGVALVLAICAGQLPRLADLLRDGRGEPGAAAALMAADGPSSVWGTRATRFVVRAETFRLGLDLKLPDAVDRCAQPATWLISAASAGQPVPDAPNLDRKCRARFERVKTYATAPWSGLSWTLFRRLPEFPTLQTEKVRARE